MCVCVLQCVLQCSVQSTYVPMYTYDDFKYEIPADKYKDLIDSQLRMCVCTLVCVCVCACSLAPACQDVRMLNNPNISMLECYVNFHSKRYTPEIHQIQKLEFLRSNSN